MPETIEIDDAAVRAALTPGLARGLEAIGQREVAAIKKALNIPVVYGDVQVTFKTRAGKEISFNAKGLTKRSSPGEPPRKETGNLQAGVSHVVETGDQGPQLAITSERAEGNPAVPDYLEYGTTKMEARPYMTPAVLRLEDYVVETLAEGFESES